MLPLDSQYCLWNQCVSGSFCYCYAILLQGSKGSNRNLSIVKVREKTIYCITANAFLEDAIFWNSVFKPAGHCESIRSSQWITCFGQERRGRYTWLKCCGRQLFWRDGEALRATCAATFRQLSGHVQVLLHQMEFIALELPQAWCHHH